MVECSFQTSGHVTSLPADPQIGAKGGAQVQPTDYSGGLLNVKDAGQLYVRRHSWDSRKTAQQKTMPNIKIWLVFYSLIQHVVFLCFCFTSNNPRN